MNLRHATLGVILSVWSAGCDDSSVAPANDAAALDATTADAADAADASAPDAPAVDAGFDVQQMDEGPVVPVTDRAAGEHRALALPCDPVDPTRCLLPWPSMAFTQADDTQATHLRLQVPQSSLAAGDSVEGLNRADGFSRASSMVVAFPALLDQATLGDGTTGAVRLIVAEGSNRGTLVPVRPALIAAQSVQDPETGVIAYPRRLLAANTEHVVVVMDSLRATGGATLTANDATRAALGLQAPRTPTEEKLRAWHAPTRALLTQAGIDPAHVLRVWGFVTRSADQPRAALRAMRAQSIAALQSGAATVQIDTVTVPSVATAALQVEGHIRGLPRWTTAGRVITRSAGQPQPVAGMTYDAPFRILLPRGGTGAYPAVVYGHGMGGNEHDDSFDGLISGEGAAKVNVRFDGLTDTDLANTFLGFLHMNLGVEQASSVLLQAFSGAMALIHSMRGVTPDGVALPAASNLREILAAPMLGTMTNPLAGRRANPDTLTWAGGSLGGTNGITLTNAEPSFIAGVANVPGAAWSHFVVRSILFDLIRTSLLHTYGADLDVQLQVSMSQNLWDEVDGVAWADAEEHPRPMLLQESIGDPVLPNLGSEFAAAALNAVQVGAVINPIAGVDSVASADGRTAITQFRVPSTVTAPYSIHGFAAQDNVASMAALQQIRAFLEGAWAGQTHVILPPNCASNTPAGSCDFSASH